MSEAMPVSDPAMTSSFPVLLRKEEDGELHVYVRDLPQVVTSGADEATALDMAADAIGVVIETLIEMGEEVPTPSPAEPGERMVAIPADVAAKLLVWRAWRASGLSKVALADRLHLAEAEVRRILDPKHGTKLAKLDATARALGKRLVVTMEDAA